MSRYTPISLPEVQDLLRQEKGWKQTNSGNEIVFQFPLSTAPYIIIKVYSTLRNNDNVCRAKGTDALRIFAINTKLNCGWVSTRRVFRVVGWKKNLTTAVLDIFKQAQGRLRKI